MDKVHYIPNYLLNPNHSVSVNVIGCGGTGSLLLTKLAMLNLTLLAQGHPGLQITAYDNDIVMPTNIGRQMFFKSDIGQYKADILINRINNAFGFYWKAITERFDTDCKSANITISCVDSIESRKEIAKALKESQGNKRAFEMPCYWIDTGNEKQFGQIVIGTVVSIAQPKSRLKCVTKIKTFTELYPNIESKPEDNTPTCSLATALDAQDLFINSFVADYTAQLMWQMFSTAKVPYNALFLNLATYQTSTLKL